MNKNPIYLPPGFMAAVGTVKPHVSPTKYNWTTVAEAITNGRKTKFEQAYAIYRWLCDNIAYDTTYSIYKADEAYLKRRGVCHAYCELFFRLGESIGLRVDIISGKSKDCFGNVSDSGHAWLLVYTDGNTGVLVDATWGAGSVNNGIFVHKSGDDSWFNVQPVWMIFTHFPNNEVYQFLTPKIDFRTFASMPGLYPELAQFGFRGNELLAKVVSGAAIDLPGCFPVDFVTKFRIPPEGTLHVGQVYEFTLRFNRPNRFAIIHGNQFYYDWTVQGDLAFARFVPSSGGKLMIAYQAQPGTNKWIPIVEYKVAEPTAADFARLKQIAPHKFR